MTTLTLGELPLEVLLDHLLPTLLIPDLLSLSSTSTFFATIGKDETFWKRKLLEDFNFTGAGTARTSGWKFIYKGLSKPQVYVWGDAGRGRLGLSDIPGSSLSRIGVPQPVRVRIPGSRIVSLVAGGTSFHALDSEGNIFVWGTLDGERGALQGDGFSERGKTARTPLKLIMPNQIRSISCGRFHSVALDSSRLIWTFLSWGRPFKLSCPQFSASSFIPVQVECGWTFVSCLTTNGDVYVWWPYSLEMERELDRHETQMNGQADKKAEALEDGTIPCVTWDLECQPTLLRPLPKLSEIPDAAIIPKKSDIQIIQIAGFDNYLVALTNYGHVLVYSGLQSAASAVGGGWEYLPEFSEANRIQQQAAFSGDLHPPSRLTITHISAHFHQFVAYSTGENSYVLIGDTSINENRAPKIIPELQNKSVISVVLGDYHNAALTENGKLLTWGEFSNGALGLGDPINIPIGAPGGFANRNTRDRAASDGIRPPGVKVPTEVAFSRKPDQQKNKFCFSAAASGWHTGALVIDLEPTDDDDDDDGNDNEIPTQTTQQQRPRNNPFLGPPGSFSGLPFVRLGFPARGGNAGARGGRGGGGFGFMPDA